MFRQEYLSSTFHVLTDSPRISNLNNRDNFQFSLSQNDEKIATVKSQKSLEPVHTLTAKQCSETGLLIHLSNHVFRYQ